MRESRVLIMAGKADTGLELHTQRNAVYRLGQPTTRLPVPVSDNHQDRAEFPTDIRNGTDFFALVAD
jgi:hypothetical protein